MRQESLGPASRLSFPGKAGVRSPPPGKKWISPGQARTPLSSPLMAPRETKSASLSSCKENTDLEESVALALALSKSIYLEAPLPVIPGLSPQKSHVLAHPHRDVSRY